MPEEKSEAIAVIGIAGKFPGADDVDQFWRNLCAGAEAVRRYSRDELIAAGANQALLDDPHYVPAGAHLENAALFDAAFFGLSPREAEQMDPQHRLFLECAWQALEASGYAGEASGRKVGVFGGTSANQYLLRYLFARRSRAHRDWRDLADEIPLGSDKDHLATRVSYKLGLTGPSVTVQTACSTSLVAATMACQSLLDFRCDIALAGGCAIETFGPEGYLHQEGGMLATDGRCRAFDANAAGTVFGSGVAIVVLKRLSEALHERDTVLAVIKGFGVNNDGASRLGYVAPNVDGQAEVIIEALAAADIDPATVTFVETHGAGTPVGDMIELAALAKAFATANGERRTPCWLGAVKNNIGHLGHAAGATGLIKTVLALHHKVLPPTLHVKKPHPQLDLEATPFRISDVIQAWEAAEHPRRAGVSSFGLGGTNAHVVLEEAPAAEPSMASPRSMQFLPLSAKTATALDAVCHSLADHLSTHKDINLADVAFTAASGRHAFAHRRTFVAADNESAAAALRTLDGASVRTGVCGGATPAVAFMLPGLGDHYAGMAANLYANEPRFRGHVDRCCDLLTPIVGRDLRRGFTQIRAATHATGALDLRKMLGRDASSSAAERPQDATSVHCAVFIVDYALAATLIDWGISPAGLIGHSLGEYVAACLAEVMSLEDTLRVVARRAGMIDMLPRGAMLAVPLSEDEIAAVLRPGIDLAAVNGPGICVLAGSLEGIADVEQNLVAGGLVCRRVHTSHAFHSTMLEPVRQPFIELMQGVRLRPPKIPMLSNVTGDWLSPDEATDPQYWGDHLCRTVRFAPGLTRLLEQSATILLEVGPGQTLSSFAALHTPESRAAPLILSTIPASYNQCPDQQHLFQTVGRLWTTGIEIDWTAFYAGEQRRRVPLPTYRFDRRRYWLDTDPAPVSFAVPIESAAAPSRREASDHFIEPPAAPTVRLHPRPRLRTGYAPPVTELECSLSAIWQDLFGFGPIGTADDFFELGGHSLLALQLANRLWRSQHVDVPLRELVENPTIARLAAWIAEDRGQHPARGSIKGPPPAHDETNDAPSRLWTYLANCVSRATGVSADALPDNLSEFNLSRVAAELMARIKRDFGLNMYPQEIIERPSLSMLVAYLSLELQSRNSRIPASQGPLGPEGEKIDRTAFLLSCVRSGSTLMRVMLAGHPDLFCPPEMHLLGYASLSERLRADNAPDRDQGLQRAFMELLATNEKGAKAHIAALTAQDLPIRDVYVHLRELTGARLLIDKSPGYAMQPEALRRMENLFHRPKYIHLLRHPYAVIESFVHNRFHRLLGAGNVDPFLLAEFVWQTTNSNIQDHLGTVDPERIHIVQYEHLVADPRGTMTALCDFLEVSFDEAILHPYEGRRMRDGVGDPNFLDHSRIERGLGVAWQTVQLPRPLSRFARQLASEFGYELPVAQPSPPGGSSEPVMVGLRRDGAKRPLFVIHPLDGSVFCYVRLSRYLDTDRPFFGLQAPGLESGCLLPDRIEDIAALYLRAIKKVQANGPYLLCGWSFGGIVAFEMAHQLETAGEEVCFLGLFDSSTPPTDFGQHDLRSHFDNYLSRITNGSGAPTASIDRSIIDRRFSVFRINSLAVQRYAPVCSQSSIVYFKAAEDEDQLQRPPPLDGWRVLTRRGLTVHSVPGDHYSMLAEPHLAALAASLNHTLAELP